MMAGIFKASSTTLPFLKAKNYHGNVNLDVNYHNMYLDYYWPLIECIEENNVNPINRGF